MNRIAMTAAAALLAAGLITGGGCGGGGGGTTPSGPATIQGTVVDDGTLQPVAGATVSVGTVSTQTADDGTWQLELQAGERTVVVAAEGYDQLQTEVTVQEGENQIGTSYLQPTVDAGRGVVSGSVGNGGNAAGARIFSGTATATSRPDGTFMIYNLPEGSQTLTAVSADGEAAGYVLVDVEPDTTTWDVTIDLNIAPPTPPGL